MDYRITFQPLLVSEMINISTQGICIYTQISNSHRLE